MPTPVRMAVELDGIAAGWLHSVEGGYASAPVVSEKVGIDQVGRKHLGAVQYEDLTIRGGLGIFTAMQGWIKGSLALKNPLTDGIIYTCQLNGNIVSTLEWHKGAIIEIGFPGPDASAKDVAYMTMRVKPGSTRYRPGKGKLDIAKYTRAKEKNWQSSNFRLLIDGCEDACQRVSRIEPFSIKQQILEYPSGSLEASNLVISFSESHADQIFKWHESFVIDGNNSVDQERTGRLLYLAEDLKTVLLTVNFTGLGIFKLTPEKGEAGGENIRRVKAEMYCEKMELEYGTL